MIGRFQPFHNGHLGLSKQVLTECNELVIVVGSAQFNYIYKDPFTGGERIEMIHAALEESEIDLRKCYIIPIINDENNARWFGYVRSMVPRFDVLYSGNEFVASLTAAMVKLRKPLFIHQAMYNGTNIRLQIAKGKPGWKKSVPKSVSKLIEQVGGVERIKMLLETDSNPQLW
jgi:nicotinamide-nucleotide adenylyltransferase